MRGVLFDAMDVPSASLKLGIDERHLVEQGFGWRPRPKVQD